MKTVVNHNNNFLAYLLLIASLFVLFFVTKNVYAQMQVSLDSGEQGERELSEMKEQLDELNMLKKELQNDEAEMKQVIDGFMLPAHEEDILEYFYDYAQEQNRENDVIVFRGIDISEPIQNDIGFREISVNISTIFAGESTLFAFLNMLSSPENPFEIYVSDFEYPMNESSGNIQAEIPLVLYFK